MKSPNHTMQRMRASRSCQFQSGCQWRLARTADAWTLGGGGDGGNGMNWFHRQVCGSDPL